MRKLDAKYDNPIDNILYNIIENIECYFKSMNFTPNMITTIGNIFGLVGIYMLLQKKFVLASIFYSIRYFFDCLDGFYARKYDMVTTFGDYYDHISDVFLNVLFLFLMYIYYPKFFTFTNFVSILFFLYALFLFVYYQEYKYGIPDESGTLDSIKHLIIPQLIIRSNKEFEKNIQWIKYFGCGTFNLLIALFIMRPGVYNIL